MLATPSIVVDPLWYPDSGASHHITHDDSTLSTKNTYTGSDKVNIGNGTGLDIHHVGHSYLHCPKFSKNVILNNLLHVPSITKKLLSVSQFARDNHVLPTLPSPSLGRNFLLPLKACSISFSLACLPSKLNERLALQASKPWKVG
uniref:Retrovirus-related Pol polyprotein from transposon TNT 1-94-like beta-barrel domain-containing protein n=1 Tax=Cajanus cajan TaxID=3821 RepID=A0A151T1H8_CAJCA|nr:hypothetical protein KK1_023255 [Cajanus cajan]